MISFILDENRKLKAEIEELKKQVLRKDESIKQIDMMKKQHIDEKNQMWSKLKTLRAAKAISHSQSVRNLDINNNNFKDYMSFQTQNKDIN